MLLFSYPPPMTVNEKRIFKFNAKINNTKYKKALRKNLIISIIIISISFLSDSLLGKLLLIGVAIFNSLLALFVYKQGCIDISSNSFTKIYDDKIVHSEPFKFFNRYKKFVIEYDTIISSMQDLTGNFVFLINKDCYDIDIVKNNSKLKTKHIKNNKISVRFYSSDTKLYIINNLSDKVKYKAKGYKGADYSDKDKDDWE